MKTYRVSEVAKMVHLSVDTLHYYEKIGLIPTIAKNKRGYKAFTETNILSIQFIINLKNTGMPLSDIKQYTDWFSEGHLTECYALLSSHAATVKQQIKEKEDFLNILGHKLTNFNELIEKRKNQFKTLN